MADQAQKEDTKKLEKEAENQRKAEELLRKVTESNVSTTFDKVGWILNHFPDTRDSDVTCLIRFWEVFEPGMIDNQAITFSNLYKATKLTSIKRARAKIQNEYKLFLASDEVRKKRGLLEKEQREWSVQNKPDFLTYTVYIDESGKTDRFLIVGSLWILDHLSDLHIFNELKDLRNEMKVDYEIHFKNINDSKLPYYNSVLATIHKYSSTISFKGISVERSGNKNINDALTKLMCYLLQDGITHEHESRRAVLPRSLTLIKDRDEIGSDHIMLREIRSFLERWKEIRYKDQISLDEFKSIESHSQVYVQIADLFTSSLNRKLNGQDTGHAKDKFSEDFLNAFGVNIQDGVIKTYGDIVSIVDI